MEHNLFPLKNPIKQAIHIRCQPNLTISAGPANHPIQSEPLDSPSTAEVRGEIAGNSSLMCIAALDYFKVSYPGTQITRERCAVPLRRAWNA